MEGRKIKKFVLAALNAKYIHSNPAVYSLKANAGEHASHVKICEYTINHTKEEILAALYGEEPDIIGFSCYLWNIEYILAIAEDLKKIRPGLIITAGGPEVSYRPEEFLRTYRFFDVIMVGEGEKTFSELLSYYFGHRSGALFIGRGSRLFERRPERDLLWTSLLSYIKISRGWKTG